MDRQSLPALNEGLYDFKVMSKTQLFDENMFHQEMEQITPLTLHLKTSENAEKSHVNKVVSPFWESIS